MYPLLLPLAKRPLTRWGGAFVCMAFLHCNHALAVAPDRITPGAPGAPFGDQLRTAEQKHDYQRVLEECDRQVLAHPNDLHSYSHRAVARWGAKKYEGALADFQHAIEIAQHTRAPRRQLVVLYYGRALLHEEQHDIPAAASDLELAVKADKGFTDAFNMLAWIRATNPDASLRNGHEAVALARHADETVPNSDKYLDTLAAAYAEAGDFKRALDAEKQAVKAAGETLDERRRNEPFLVEADARAKLYARSEPYREDPTHPQPAN